MASQRSDTRTEAGEPRAASDLDDELCTALDGDAARQVRFWRARAGALAAELATVQQRLAVLAAHLPARYAPLLVCDEATLEAEADWPDPLAGWKESIALEAGSVATELPRVWHRLRPLSSR
jgi:hypothetical protein